MILMIDNYDSFTYNLVRYIQELQFEISVYRNNTLSLADIEQLSPSHIILSPGPCTPFEAGICLELIPHFANKIPILGVCLGLQCIAQAFGGQIVRATEVMHGKSSVIFHDGQHIFQNIPNPFRAGRYHSLVVAPSSMPACLQVSAWTKTETGERDVIMALRHREWDIEAVQFHPESILTEHGHQMLNAFISRTSCPSHF